MSLISALTKKWDYSVENPGDGRLVYREENREYTFPFYEEGGVWVLADFPSAQRIHYFFSWQSLPVEFSPETRERVLSRILKRFRDWSLPLRVRERGEAADGEFAFHPELFDHRAAAIECLDESGLRMFSEYGSVELLHKEYGLEICGIRRSADVHLIAALLHSKFPQWHHCQYCLHDEGVSDWTLSASLFPARSCNSEWLEGD
jgi:hypothetical protein